jgi:assimilatory nitrate reductase catalytic subunit
MVQIKIMPSSEGETHKTTCPYCGVGCGVIASKNSTYGIKIVGDPKHPANYGSLCTKGLALIDTISLEGRLLYPMKQEKDGIFSVTSWDSALNNIATSLSTIINEYGPESIAFYLSGQLLTEDYYVANKLMKGFIGSANVDTNSRLCMASTVSGHMRAFGSDTVPATYEDLDLADLIILVGSNTAWCHPVLFWRLIKIKERGAKIVVIDTRQTETAESADLFLEIAPGSDQALFSGLLVYLAENNALDSEFINNYTIGFEEALNEARLIALTTEVAASRTGLKTIEITEFYEIFASTQRVVTVFSQGVNQSSQGADKVNSILNCHLATGRIGKPGSSPFSFTGQPNAMGGREVGGLANMLAAHMSFNPKNIDRVRRFWNAPRMAEREGLKAVQMFEAIAEGKIKALWVAGTNPAASLPNADAARKALSKLDLFIVSENVLENDTINSGPHILLPALAWGEKDGTVTNSERRISRQRSFLSIPGEARADWAIFAEVGRRMGFLGFDFHSVASVFREHAALSSFENDGSRDFDIGGFLGLTDEAYDKLPPTQWPIRMGETEGQKRFFVKGGFFTQNGRANFVSPAQPTLASQTSPEFPLRLNTGRVRDQWHTMTRTGKSPRLARHTTEPYVEIGPEDAHRMAIEDGGFARVTTAFGNCILRVRITTNQPIGSIFAPIHWTDETASHSRVGALVAPFIDQVSGQPEFKATPAAISSIFFKWKGYLTLRRPIQIPSGVWWARIALNDAIAYSVAGFEDQTSWLKRLRSNIADGDFIQFSNRLDKS